MQVPLVLRNMVNFGPQTGENQLCILSDCHGHCQVTNASQPNFSTMFVNGQI